MPALPLSALSGSPGRYVILGSRVIVAAVFVWAAVPKILEPGEFADAIANYHLVPTSWAGPLATIVPFVELAIGLALLSGIYAQGGALCALVLLVGFTVAMGQAMARGIDIDCGCFGSATDTEVGATALVRNVSLLVACAVIVMGPEVPWARRADSA